MPAVGAEGAVGHPGRMYTCALCQREVLLCSGCDRGQRYCSVGCREQARRRSLREAGRRYQDSRAGRFAHARRSRRYRQRQKMVTHQASQGAPQQTTVVADRAEAEVVAAAAAVVAPAWHCWWCGGVCVPVVRRGFLRHGRIPYPVATGGSRGPVHGQSP
jgi:MinD superfamily P-loop ATPase